MYMWVVQALSSPNRAKLHNLAGKPVPHLEPHLDPEPADLFQQQEDACLPEHQVVADLLKRQGLKVLWRATPTFMCIYTQGLLTAPSLSSLVLKRGLRQQGTTALLRPLGDVQSSTSIVYFPDMQWSWCWFLVLDCLSRVCSREQIRNGGHSVPLGCAQSGGCEF